MSGAGPQRKNLLFAVHTEAHHEALVEDEVEDDDGQHRDAGRGHHLVPHGAGVLGLEALQAVCRSRLKARNLKNRSSATVPGSPMLDCCSELGIETFSSPTTSDWIRIGCDAVKMGPGMSERSHKKDEYITRDEIASGLSGYIAFLETFFRIVGRQ